MLKITVLYNQFLVPTRYDFVEIFKYALWVHDIGTLVRDIRDMFHVYLNRFEFHFLRLHIIKTNKFCFFMHNRRVLGIAKLTRWQFIA